MGYCDALMAAGQAQVLFDADPGRQVAICHPDGRPTWDALWEHNPAIATPEAVAAGARVTRLINAKGARPYIHYPFSAETGWRYTGWSAIPTPPVLWLTESERANGIERMPPGRPVFIEPHIAANKSPNKCWPFRRFVDVVERLPSLTFVQPIWGGLRAIPRPNVVPIATASFREACTLLAHAALFVGVEGGLMHAARALGVPSVVIFGGCVPVWLTGYRENVNLIAGGDETPCGRYLACRHCQSAMEEIMPYQVAHCVAELHWAAGIGRRNSSEVA
jgi:hypothetical protein